MVERAVLIGGQRLVKESFGAETGGGEDMRELKPAGTLNDMEKAAIKAALDRSEGNLTQAARILGLTRQTLYRRMQKYDLEK